MVGLNVKGAEKDSWLDVGLMFESYSSKELSHLLSVKRLLNNFSLALYSLLIRAAVSDNPIVFAGPVLCLHRFFRE